MTKCPLFKFTRADPFFFARTRLSSVHHCALAGLYPCLNLIGFLVSRHLNALCLEREAATVSLHLTLDPGSQITEIFICDRSAAISAASSQPSVTDKHLTIVVNLLTIKWVIWPDDRWSAGVISLSCAP